MDKDSRQITFCFEKQVNRWILRLDREYEEEELRELLSRQRLNVRLVYADGREKVYPVFAQNAMAYGDYSDYMKMHGCACCSLTTVLAGLRRSRKDLLPQDTIVSVEKDYVPPWIFEKNYGKSLPNQMPLSLYGISKILENEKIKNRYIGSFDRRTALEVIDRHLSGGNPVIFETSRIRYKHNWPVHFCDKRYAGSYHTMVMLGYDINRQVIFTDSANRDWAGPIQRLKTAPLSELMDYMFPQKNTQDNHLYFSGRRNTGGFILVSAWSETPEWNLRSQ